MAHENDRTAAKHKILALAGAGAIAAAALAGGGAYSLWSDAADVDGQTVVSGNLDIEALGSSFQDVSADRTDSPHAIDLSTWRMVPGDTIAGDYALDLGLEGDNLVAAVDTSALDQALTDANVAQYVTVTVEMRDAAGKPIAAQADGTYLVQASGDGQAAGQDDPGIAIIANPETDGTADATARVTIEFSASTPDQVLTQADLAGIGGDVVTLEQVRAGGNFK